MEAIISYHFTTSSRKESDSFSRVVVVKDVTTALKNRGKANIKITEEEKIQVHNYLGTYFLSQILFYVKSQIDVIKTLKQTE